MKSVLLFLAAIIACSSCKKEQDQSPAALNGQWKMVKVTDAANGATTTKPSSVNGDVVLNIGLQTDTSGTITGNTPTNVLSGGFTRGSGNSIHIPGVAASKAAETPWGALFMDNITAAQSYRIECRELRITTTGKTLFFQKQ